MTRSPAPTPSADTSGRARTRAGRRLTLLLVAGVLVLAACGGGGSGDGASGDARSGDRGGDAAAPDPTAAPQERDCAPEQEPVEPQGPSAETVTIQAPGAGQPGVEAVVYPRPESRGDPWSQWGQGLVLPDGRFVAAMGDHLGRDGNSHLFVYEPERARMTRFADVLANVEHQAGDWGYGKIHGQLVPGRCGEVYLATYWGTDQGIQFGGSYQGDVLLRLDPATLALESLGVPVPEHGIPSLAGFAPGGLVYGEAVIPAPDDPNGSKDGAFFAYDTATGEVVLRVDDERLNGFRNVIVDTEGTAYISAAGGRLLVYRPGATALTDHPQPLPGGFLRASTRPAPDGTVYGVTERPPHLFALRPDGAVDDLGAAAGYTTSLALHPDGDRFFYVPGAHGNSAEQGTPLISVDTATGEQTTVVELNELVGPELGLTLGGSYSVAVDPAGERVYVSLNAGSDRREPWGEVVLVIVDLP